VDYLQLDLLIILYVCLIRFFLLTLFVCILILSSLLQMYTQPVNKLCVLAWHRLDLAIYIFTAFRTLHLVRFHCLLHLLLYVC
jgi:hypothetical protein